MTEIYDGNSSGATRPDGRSEDGAIQFDYDGHDAPSTAVVEAVAAATGRDPTDLTPLHDHVDTDALDAIVGRRADGNGTVHVSFAYDGVDVGVDGDGVIELWPHEAADEGHDGPRTAAGLHAELQSLLGAAVRNGVDVYGGWELRNGPALPDWDVHVTRLQKPVDGDARDRTAPR